MYSYSSINFVNHFLPGFEREDSRREREQPPKKGNTVYIYGHNLTEALVKKAFSNFGVMINITMEPEKK